jgi:hypothetical protein
MKNCKVGPLGPHNSNEGLNKFDYVSKMHTILNDLTKFKCLSEDLTIKRETKLIKLLNRLLNEGHISEQFSKMAKPTGSIPGRLYGLPKIHKYDVPLTREDP